MSPQVETVETDLGDYTLQSVPDPEDLSEGDEIVYNHTVSTVLFEVTDVLERAGGQPYVSVRVADGTYDEDWAEDIYSIGRAVDLNINILPADAENSFHYVG